MNYAYLAHLFSKALWLFLAGGCFNAFGQKEANVWYFGDRAGLDFNQCVPSPLENSNMEAYEGIAIISDRTTGTLLFYTNAERVWNRENRVMPHGDSLKGTRDIDQAALIVPDPAHESQYYLFTLGNSRYIKDTAAGNTLYYSILNRRLDQGRGDVVPSRKNIPLTSGLTNKLTAIPHTNDRDYWVITHLWNSQAFLVHLLTASGVSDPDTVYVGSRHGLHSGVQSTQEMAGYLRASPNGRKLASAVYSSTPRPFDLFDFNAATGSISNYVNLGNLRTQYGVSFSPDNSKLYVVTTQRAGGLREIELIRQYDLEAGDSLAIAASGKSIVYGNPLTNIPQGDKITSAGFYIFDLQIGPDGRIYAASDYINDLENNFLVINDPNRKGFDCDVQLRSFDLGKGTLGAGRSLPNFMQHTFNNLQPRECPPPGCVTGEVTLFPNPTADAFQIRLKGDCFHPYRLRLTNALGQVLAERNVDNVGSETINLTPFAQGMYFVYLYFPDREIVRKVIEY